LIVILLLLLYHDLLREATILRLLFLSLVVSLGFGGAGLVKGGLRIVRVLWRLIDGLGVSDCH
jgi:hypothetical protein